MSNITLNTSEFNVVRVSKAGKESYRGLLGIMTSGNKAERELAAKKFVLVSWENHTYRPLAKEMARVFSGKTVEDGAAFIGLDINAPKKLPMLAWMTGIVRKFEGKTAKGEKAMYLSLIQTIIAQEDAKIGAYSPETATANTEVPALV